jgi:uncharacterized membrane protein YeaQ/YmgE (transglycosylase-associated protein family)
MSMLVWVFFGFFAGFIASKVFKRTRQGVVWDIVVGLVAALIGGSLFATIGTDGVFVAVIGAVLLLAAYRAVSRVAH